jgi:hypothetical protein
MQSDHRSLASAACIYVHNALKVLCHDYFTIEEKDLYLQLLKPIKADFTSAKDALLLLLRRPNVFENVYSNITTSEKLDLLEVLYNEIWTSWQSDLDTVLAKDQAEFLALTFCKKSDLILKTVDTHVNSIDPTEVILILNILGLLTTQSKISDNARCLLINCKCKYINFQYINLIECKNNNCVIHIYRPFDVFTHDGKGGRQLFYSNNKFK